MYSISTHVMLIVFINIIGMGLLKSIQDLCIFLWLEEVSHTYSENSVFHIDSFVPRTENSLLE